MNPRYLIRGIMDGSISTLGVVIGAFNPEASLIVAAGAAGAIANGISNIIAAFTAEYADQYTNLRALEQATLRELEGTYQEKALKREILISAVYDGLASIIGGVLPLFPFVFFPYQFSSKKQNNIFE